MSSGRLEPPVLARSGHEAARPALRPSPEASVARPSANSCGQRVAQRSARRAGVARWAGRCAGTAAETRRSGAPARAPRRMLASPSATTRLARPSASASSAPTARPVRIRSIARLSPMRRGRRTVPPSMSGTPKRRQKTPKVAVVAATRRSHQTASSRAARDGVALDGGDHRLRSARGGSAPSGPSRTHVVVEGESGAARRRRRAPRPPTLPRSPSRAQVGAGAEVAAGAGEDGDARDGVGVEGPKGVGERARRRPVDGVAHLGAIDRHGPDLSVFALVDANSRRHGEHLRRKRGSLVSAASVSRSTAALTAGSSAIPRRREVDRAEDHRRRAIHLHRRRAALRRGARRASLARARRSGPSARRCDACRARARERQS